jgi:LysR family transcriptional regulator, transcriptional activator of the cysJI operon
MEFDQLRTFLIVLEHGSFTRAAEVLGLSQSTISAHVKQLEQAVEARLLDRNRERVTPTHKGRMLRRYAGQLVALRQEALGQLRDEDEQGAGHVAIAASTIPAEYLLPDALADLRRTHPRASVTLSVSDSRRAVASLLAGECDLALVGSRTSESRLAFTAFAEDEIVVVAPSPNPWAEREGSLVEVPLVVRSEGSGTRAAAAEVMASLRSGSSSAGIVEVGSTEATKRCVLAGVGIAFISRLAVADELARGELVTCAVPGTPIRRTFYVVTRRSTTPSGAATTLVEILTRHA